MCESLVAEGDDRFDIFISATSPGQPIKSRLTMFIGVYW
jgi:hypothetical protein